MRRRRLAGGWNPGVERRGLRLSPGVVVGSLVVGGLVIGVVHNRLHGAGKPDPLVGALQATSVGPQVGAARVGQSSATLWKGIFQGPALAEENHRLKEERDLLRLEQEKARLLAAENLRLRALLGFADRKTPQPLAADVIAWLPSPFERTITLARGSRGGVVEGMAVRTTAGLVGKVIEVSPFTAKVRLLTDPDSGVGVRIAGAGAFGILRGVEEIVGAGARRAGMEVIHLEKDLKIEVGAAVFSSGHGGVFPPDVPVGTVESVREDSTHLLKIARVRPFAPMPGDLRQVLLLPPLLSPEVPSAPLAERQQASR